MEEFKYLGKKTSSPSKKLDVFPKPDNITHIKFESNELTSFCPVTGQPDFSTLLLEYGPDKLCLESKSLKLYIWSFREDAIFAEGLANTITNDVFEALQPLWVKVSILQNIRGGIQLTAVAEKQKE